LGEGLDVVLLETVIANVKGDGHCISFRGRTTNIFTHIQKGDDPLQRAVVTALEIHRPVSLRAF
jgi:hypothetical protein